MNAFTYINRWDDIPDAMIECSSANIEAWHQAAQQWGVSARGQIMQPPPGCPHPSSKRSMMQ